MVVERLHICEDTHGVWFAAHQHHILHFNQTVTVGHFSTKGGKASDLGKKAIGKNWEWTNEGKLSFKGIRTNPPSYKTFFKINVLVFFIIRHGFKKCSLLTEES